MPNQLLRRQFIGGSDARIIMGDDEGALLRLWREKRGEIEHQDLSGNLIVQLGRATEELNRRWYEANTGQVIADVQRRVRHPTVRWMGATLDGRIQASGAVFESKFMLPWSFSEEAAAEKHMAQLQHNMWVVALDPLFVQSAQSESNRSFLTLLASYFAGRHALQPYAADLLAALRDDRRLWANDALQSLLGQLARVPGACTALAHAVVKARSVTGPECSSGLQLQIENFMRANGPLGREAESRREALMLLKKEDIEKAAAR